MNWDAIGALGEIIGAIGVIVTLAYLARQIRNQNQATEIDAFEGIMESFNHLNSMIAADEDLYRIFNTGLYHPEELNDIEAGRFSFLFRAYMNINHKILRTYQRGAVDEDLWREHASEAAEMLATPGGLKFVEGHPTWDYWQEFQQHLRNDPVIDISLGRKDA